MTSDKCTKDGAWRDALKMVQITGETSNQWKIYVSKTVVAILVFYLFFVIIRTIIDQAYLLTCILICIDLTIMTLANLFIRS